jgi:hypothetical protein
MFLLHYPQLDYNVWFTVRDGSIGLCLLIPLKYLRDLFVLIWIHALTSVICLLLLLLLLPLLLIIIIIIINPLCTGYLQMHTWKNHAPRVHSIAAILQLHFMEHVLLFPMYVLYFYISTFLHMCAVPSMPVFCSSFILCLLGMLFRYFLHDSEMVSVAPLITGITYFTFQICHCHRCCHHRHHHHRHNHQCIHISTN